MNEPTNQSEQLQKASFLFPFPPRVRPALAPRRAREFCLFLLPQFHMTSLIGDPTVQHPSAGAATTLWCLSRCVYIGPLLTAFQFRGLAAPETVVAVGCYVSARALRPRSANVTSDFSLLFTNINFLENLDLLPSLQTSSHQIMWKRISCRFHFFLFNDAARRSDDNCRINKYYWVINLEVFKTQFKVPFVYFYEKTKENHELFRITHL